MRKEMRTVLKTVFWYLIVIAVIPGLYYGMTAYSYLLGEKLFFESSEIQSIYIFRFNKNRVVRIDDPYNKIIRSWGGSPISKKIVDGKREVVFDEAAILKTKVDSIEPHIEYVKYKGYMGLTTNQSSFEISRDGEIKIVWKNTNAYQANELRFSLQEKAAPAKAG